MALPWFCLAVVLVAAGCGGGVSLREAEKQLNAYYGVRGIAATDLSWSRVHFKVRDPALKKAQFFDCSATYDGVRHVTCVLHGPVDWGFNPDRRCAELAGA